MSEREQKIVKEENYCRVKLRMGENCFLRLLILVILLKEIDDFLKFLIKIKFSNFQTKIEIENYASINCAKSPQRNKANILQI